MAIFVLETRPGCLDLVLGAKEMDEAEICKNISSPSF
jgi:hypothetical protein